MPTITSYTPGTPSWVDLASPDLPASVAFYSSLFGWEAIDQGAEAGHYHMFELGGVPVAGGAPIMMEGQPPAWTSYISVEDTDESIAKVKQAGGVVFVEPMDVLDVGRMAVFADPTGAVAAVWQPRKHTGAGLVNEPNTLTWNELFTRDAEGAKSFYEAVFGWRGETVEMGPMKYTEWKLGDTTIGGMLADNPGIPPEVPAHWLTYFGTADTDATVTAATDLGATLAAEPMDVPAGRFAVLADPTGAMFAVIALASP
jgi:predicted enzyme related to lactoylglutathione lyase